MSKKALLFLFLGIAIGAAIGYLAAPETEVRVERGETHPRRAARAADGDQSSALAALRRRVKELERRLAETTAAASTLTNTIPVARPEAERGPRPPNMAGFRAHMAELEKNDPARYAQMTNRMAKWRERRLAHTQDRLDFLASLDTSKMTPKELANHEKLQSLIARQEELMQSMRPDAEDVTDAEREQAHQEMRKNFHELRELERAERNMLLKETARNLGCKGDVATELVETIKTIYDVTQSGGPGRGGPGGPGGPGGGPGPSR